MVTPLNIIFDQVSDIRKLFTGIILDKDIVLHCTGFFYFIVYILYMYFLASLFLAK